MNILREGVEVDVPVSQMTDEERRAYNREAKKRSREKAAEAEKSAQAQAAEESAWESLDPSIKAFIERFDALSPADKRDWLRVHFRFLQLEYERVTRDYLAFRGLDAEQKAAEEKLIKRLAAKYECTEEEIVRAKAKIDIADHYGFSEEEVERLLDPSYKPEPLQFPAPQPAFDREWHGAKPALTDAQVRTVVENTRAAGEVRQAVTETPMNRLEKFEQMTGVPASWCKP